MTTITQSKGPSTTDGSQHNIHGRWDVPRPIVVPEISSVPAGQLLADSNDGTIQCLRVTINPGDAVTAAARLAKGYPDVGIVYPDGEISFTVNADGSDGEITSLYLLVVGDGGTDATANGIVDSSAVNIVGDLAGTDVGAVMMPTATEAMVIAATNMVALTFSSADAVRDVVITMGPTFDSGTQVYINVLGRSYA